MQATHLRDGAAAEALAARHLEAHGYAILARNVRCRGGEVDLIADDGRSLVFVEVRLRKSGRFGGAAASITGAKQRRVILAAQHWLAGDGRRHASRACRFDAILLDSLDAARIEWIRGAFDAS
ncbi:YraN family protein [Zoogloea sp.]|jgi:putative endonuclease|uniref:YraN family protein n=1 Tax=Zoogloea sp. TaxID=49181 RepID=UPI0035B08DE3